MNKNKKSIIIVLLALVALTTFGQGSTIADTYWRNEQTGDWLIGFAEKHVIYNNKVWEIASLTEKKDAYTLTVGNGETIKVGKAKNGRRTIAIGKDKPIVCSLVTTEYLPEYPTKDLTQFKDNGYRTGDTATIVGWLKDCPAEVLDKNREFTVTAMSLFMNFQDVHASGTIDQLGRFSVKVPLENTQEVYADLRRSNLVMVLEPGETYFYLHDYKTGQQLMMGDRARVQNELLAQEWPDMEYEKSGDELTASQVIDYKNRLSAMHERNCARLDSFFTQHPTLSRRFEDYQRMSILTMMAQAVAETVYNTKEGQLPAEVVDYINAQVWPNAAKPYTVSRKFGDFLYYYHVNAEYGNALLRQQHMTPEAFLRMDEEGQLPLSQEERAFVERWAQMVVDYRGVNPSAYAELDKKYEGMKNRILAFLSEDHVMEAITTHMADPLVIVAEMVDSTYTDPLLRDIVKTRRLCQQIDENRMPLTDTQQAIVDQIQTPVARQYVLAHNDKYLALQRRDISREQSLKSNDDLAGMSDGEQILRKITEPYRGRLILLDVWGTWCGPCKDALSHSKEEYERLKDYNLVYLYLANHSEDEAWKNVIKEYDLTGDDIVHYNLPADQLAAVERFLRVRSFPSYRLIDRDGTVLDVNADPRNLEGLARLLKNVGVR